MCVADKAQINQLLTTHSPKVAFQPGLVHLLVTPLKDDHSVDYETYARLLEFHLNNGADALALVPHTGEPARLSDAEQRERLAFAIRQVQGRVPVIAHAGDAGTPEAVDRARFAQDAGAAAVVATVATVNAAASASGNVQEHLALIGAAVKLPYLVYFTADEASPVKLSADQVLKLVDRLPNFAGVVDASRDWPFMIGTLAAARTVRPDFQIMSATDFMVSAGTIGAQSMFSPLAGVAPQLIRRLYDLCRQGLYADARLAQEDIAALYQVLRAMGVGGLRGAVAAMGRPCGPMRAPHTALGPAMLDMLGKALQSMPALAGEPRGW